MDTFSKVTTLSNWGYWDQLGGKTLKEGEIVSVFWPDGTITQSTTIHIDRVEFSLGPRDGMSEDCSAYLEVELHGADVRVYLRDSKIQLLRRDP